MTDDDKMLALAKNVLQHHFGYLAPNTTTECWVCNIAWPCPPALLAVEAQQSVLSR